MKIVMSEGLLEATAFPPCPGLRIDGQGSSRPGLPSSVKAGLGLWRHDLGAGTRVEFTGPAEDHALYVLEGVVRAGDKELGQGCAVIVGRGGATVIEAGAQGAAVLHYLGDGATRPDKPGGCVHILDEKGILAREDWTGGFHRLLVLYADSHCPNCSVWLHQQNNQAGKFTHPHAHSTDEVISILAGELLFGVKTLKEGGSVAVAKDAFYSFRTGPSGLTFLNFRQDVPFYLKKGADPSMRKGEREMLWGGSPAAPLEPAVLPA